MTDIIIIGGGIIGMLTARNLRLAGASITLIEKQQTGRESSWAGGGIVSPLYPWRYSDSISVLAKWGQANYPELTQQLLENTGIDPEYEKSGLLMIAPEEQDKALEWASQFDMDLQIVDPQQIATIEPEYRTADSSAIWMPEIAQIRNPRIAKSLRAEIERLDVNILTDTEALSFEWGSQGITSVVTRQGKLSADKYAVCTGAWTGSLLLPLGVSIDVNPVQGQMILFKGEPDKISRIMLEQDRYVIPRRDGRVLFGSTVEDVDFNKHTTETARDELYQIATDRFPCLKDYEIEHHWAGLRPGTPDGVPLICSHPGYDNLFINAGHFRNGVVLGPASCQLMSEIMLDLPPSFNQQDYALKD